VDRKGLLYQLNPTQRAKAAVDIRAAADLVEKTGWTQETYADERGRICLIEAIVRATGGGPQGETGFDDRYTLALIAFGKYTGMLAVVWNDIVATDQAYVLTTMRQCADWLDELALVSA
jgi:hypothetical protein